MRQSPPRLSAGAAADILRAMPDAIGSEVRPAGSASSGGTAVVVLGMHRSGTSALARCCNLLGVDLGTEFIPTQKDNRSGFWEDARIKEADDLALAALDLVWDDVRPFPEEWRNTRGLTAAEERVLAALGELAGRAPLHGVKDPRISRLLPVWLPLFARLGTRPIFLIALRHPEEVAASLARRDGLSRPRAHLLWLRYTLEAELHTRGHPRAFVFFDDLLRDWRTTLARAAARAGIVWPVAFDAAAQEIDRFLDPSQQHHRVAEAALDDLPVARRSHAVYQALRTASDDGGAGAREVLDGVRAELAAADELLAPVLAEIEAEVALPDAPAAEPEAEPAAEPPEREREEEREPELAAGTAEVDADGPGDEQPSYRAARRSAHEREVDRLRRNLAVAHELVHRRDAELREAEAALRCERERVWHEIETRQAALDASRAEVASLRAQLAARDAELEATREQVRSALRVIADVEASVSWRLTAPLRALAATLRKARGKVGSLAYVRRRSRR